jgi:hypothetical protein
LATQLQKPILHKLSESTADKSKVKEEPSNTKITKHKDPANRAALTTIAVLGVAFYLLANLDRTAEAPRDTSDLLVQEQPPKHDAIPSRTGLQKGADNSASLAVHVAEQEASQQEETKQAVDERGFIAAGSHLSAVIYSTYQSPRSSCDGFASSASINPSILAPWTLGCACWITPVHDDHVSDGIHPLSSSLSRDPVRLVHLH